jgi:hypothetical protein
MASSIFFNTGTDIAGMGLVLGLGDIAGASKAIGAAYRASTGTPFVPHSGKLVIFALALKSLVF